MSPLWIALTRVGATRSIDVNAAMIAFVDPSGSGGSCITFGGGERLTVKETPAQIGAIVEAVTPQAEALEAVASAGIDWGPLLQAMKEERTALIASMDAPAARGRSK